MKSKRLLTSILTLSMLASTAVPALATGQNEITGTLPNTGYSDVTLEVTNNSGGGTEPDIIIVEVPVELPIVMDLDGNITVPTNAKIINHVQDKDIKVIEINATLDSGWSAANYTDDFTSKTDDTKELGLSFRNDAMDTTGTFSLTAGNWNITANSELPLNMGVKLSKQSESAKSKIATIGFTIDWASDNSGGNEPDPEPVPVTVTFITDGNGTLEGETTVTINKGETAPFPTVNPNADYILDHWEDSDGNIVTANTTFTKNTEIHPIFIWVDPNPSNGLDLSTDEATSLGFTFAPFDTGLVITAFENKQFKSEINIPEQIGDFKVLKLGDNLFLNQTNITKVTMPDSVKVVGTGVFMGCNNLVSVKLSNRIEVLSGDTFRNCSKITSVELPESLYNIRYSAFQNCNSLKEIVIPDKVHYITGSAFADCTNLESIQLPNELNSMEDGNTFSGCTNLKSITIPSSTEKLNSFTFHNSSITTINIHKPMNSISGAPWGATNATVNWLG